MDKWLRIRTTRREGMVSTIQTAAPTGRPTPRFRALVRIMGEALELGVAVGLSGVVSRIRSHRVRALARRLRQNRRPHHRHVNHQIAGAVLAVRGCYGPATLQRTTITPGRWPTPSI